MSRDFNDAEQEPKTLNRLVSNTCFLGSNLLRQNEPCHEKTNKVTVRPAKTQISLGIRPVRSESSLSAWRKLGSLATHKAHSEDTDQTGRISRLICVFAGCTVILLVLSCRGSNKHGETKSIFFRYKRKHIEVGCFYDKIKTLLSF